MMIAYYKHLKIEGPVEEVLNIIKLYKEIDSNKPIVEVQLNSNQDKANKKCLSLHQSSQVSVPALQ